MRCDAMRCHVLRTHRPRSPRSHGRLESNGGILHDEEEEDVVARNCFASASLASLA